MSAPRALASRGLVALALALGGCRTATIPYELAAVPSRTAPIHRRSIAVLPLVDAREGPDRDSDEEVFVYRGTAFRTTDLRDLRGGPERAMAEILARHLVRAGVFASVILVDRAEDAPEAELLLEARIRRARGYVEAEERPEKSEKPREERSVLAEVWLADVTVRDRAGSALVAADVGWTIWDERRGEPEPWAVLGEALRTAVQQAVTLLGRSDLSGAERVQTRVELGARSSSGAPDLAELATAAPQGWRTRTASAAPSGWRLSEGACRGTTLIAAQTQRFHRALGPYVPAVAVWTCGPESRLTIDDRAEFPALYRGRTAGGAHLFVHALGASNWPEAVAQISRFFEARPPAARHIFEIGP